MENFELKKQALEDMIKGGKINQLLYKYKQDNNFTKKIITDNTLWFAHPSEFNDPYDCTSYNKYTKEDFTTWIQQQRKGILQRDIDKTYQKLDIKKEVDGVLNTLGILCLSKRFDDILMWSHYADFHKGLCFQFDILEDIDFFTVAKKVEYSDRLQAYNHFTESEKITEKIIIPKYKEWEYEEEVRIIKTVEDIKSNKGSQSFRFKPEALKKIIFGCKADSKMIHEYKKLCNNDRMRHVEFSQMQQKNDGTYKLKEKSI